LFAGAATEGEKNAAERARQRILGRLQSMQAEDPSIEYRFSLGDVWSRKVFLALLRRYGLRPYRYHRQRHTTVMVRVPKGFVDQTLWPEFEEISQTLRAYLSDITDRVVSEVLHRDSSEAGIVTEEGSQPRTLPPPTTNGGVDRQNSTATRPAAQAPDAPSTPNTTSQDTKWGKSRNKRRKRHKRRGR